MRPSSRARKLSATMIAARPYQRKRVSRARRTFSRASIAETDGRAGVGRAASVILFPVLLDDPERDHVQDQGDDEQRQAQAERRQGLGAVELLVAGEQGD